MKVLSFTTTLKGLKKIMGRNLINRRKQLRYKAQTSEKEKIVGQRPQRDSPSPSVGASVRTH